MAADEILLDQITQFADAGSDLISIQELLDQLYDMSRNTGDSIQISELLMRLGEDLSKGVVEFCGKKAGKLRSGW
jgi:hypothetical protein